MQHFNLDIKNRLYDLFRLKSGMASFPEVEEKLRAVIPIRRRILYTGTIGGTLFTARAGVRTFLVGLSWSYSATAANTSTYISIQAPQKGQSKNLAAFAKAASTAATVSGEIIFPDVEIDASGTIVVSGTDNLNIVYGGAVRYYEEEI